MYSISICRCYIYHLTIYKYYWPEKINRLCNTYSGSIMRVFEIILVVLLAVTLKSLIVPQASIASNVVHIVYKLIQAVHRPMHKTKESDIAGINGHRAMYRLATMMEPKFPVPSEKQRIQMEDGRIIPIEILRPEKCKLQLCPVVLWFHGGGFVIGDTDMYRHVTTAIAEFADVVVIAVTYRLGEIVLHSLFC